MWGGGGGTRSEGSDECMLVDVKHGVSIQVIKCCVQALAVSACRTRNEGATHV